MPKTIEDLIKQVEEAIEKQDSVAEEQTRSFSSVDDRLSQLQAELEAEKAKREAIEQELQLQVVGQTMSEIHSFADGLVREGRLPPSLKNKAVTLLSVAANLDDTVKSYALGDVEEAEQTPYALVSDLLNALPQVNGLRQKATASNDRTQGDVRRYSSDPTAASEMHELVKQVQKSEGLSYLQAFEKVRRESLSAQG